MGATNQIKGTNLSLQLDNKKCPQCQQTFTKEEIDDNNYDVWFDTTNEVKLIPMEELKKDNYYKPFGRTGYELTIWIRSIEHEICPNTERCQGCYNQFLEGQVKKFQDYYYCPPCYQQINSNQKNHESK